MLTLQLSQLELESGKVLESPQIAYRIWGTPNADGSNVVWVCHALTGDSNVLEWWSGLFGSGKTFNPEEWCIICANVIGSCYGSTGPLSEHPFSKAPYYHLFPRLTIRDLVRAQIQLADFLGIARIGVLIGASMGGQLALEWNVMEPWRFQRSILIATNAQHSPWGVAFNEVQRMAIQADPSWRRSCASAGKEGLKVARSQALLSYRAYSVYQRDQPRDSRSTWSQPSQSYQRYQGEKFAARFNAFSYWRLSEAMDSHDVARGRGSLQEALQRISSQVLLVGISSDLLFPLQEQKLLAEHIPNSWFTSIHSPYGHDGFLVETEQISALVDDFMKNDLNQYRQIRFKTQQQNPFKTKNKCRSILPS